MGKSKKICGIFLGIMSILTLSASTAFAGQATNQASIAITPGELALTIPQTSTSFSGIQLNGMQQTANADVGTPVTVLDSTGYGNGWTLQVSASPFQEQAPPSGMATGTTPKSLSAGSLTLATDMSISPIGTNAPLPVNKMMGTASVIDNTQATTVVSAARNAGMGEYNINFPSQALTLTANPGTTYVDTTNYPGQPTPYSSTITWQLSVGPSSTPAPAPMQGSEFPPGTTADTASAASIDGNLNTYSTSGSGILWLNYTFPAPQSITSVQVAASARFTGNVQIIVYGTQNGVKKQIGPATDATIIAGKLNVFTPISVSPGNYDKMEIYVGSSTIYPQVNEVSYQ